MVGEFGETVVIDWGLAKSKGKEDVHEEDRRKTFQALSIGEEAEVAKTAYGHAMCRVVCGAPSLAGKTLSTTTLTLTGSSLHIRKTYSSPISIESMT